MHNFGSKFGLKVTWYWGEKFVLSQHIARLINVIFSQAAKMFRYAGAKSYCVRSTHIAITSASSGFGSHPMCLMLLGIWTQRCIRSSYTETLGPGKEGSAKAPTGMATASG